MCHSVINKNLLQYTLEFTLLKLDLEYLKTQQYEGIYANMFPHSCFYSVKEAGSGAGN